MKKLMKSEVCGSMNSTFVYCSWKKSQHKLLKKKKKGENIGEENAAMKSWIQTCT